MVSRASYRALYAAHITQVHPFQDGNGRVARALASLVFLRANWFPLLVHWDMKAEYNAVLSSACSTMDATLELWTGEFVTEFKKPRRTDDPWDLTERPHARAKLRLLSDYFGRWLTIWNAAQQREWASSDWCVIDLFASQGIYTDGDTKVSGSPLVYLEQIARIGSKLKTNGIRIHLLLVELKLKNYEMLKSSVAEFMETPMPRSRRSSSSSS